MDIYQTIMQRSSVRSFYGRPLDAGRRAKLDEACRRATESGGGAFAIVLAAFPQGRGELRPGTYGVIRGALDYLVLATDGSDAAALDGAGAMERIILQATALGLGTCWIAATFRGSAFEAAARDIPQGLRIAAVSPVGVATGRRHLLERVTRLCVRETSRKPFGSLFFDGSFNRPLAEGGGPYARAFEAVRRAPSAVNAQPWRLLVDAEGRRVHFYMAARSRYIMLDMGIALCHFALMQPGGSYAQCADAPRPATGPEYLTTWTPG